MKTKRLTAPRTWPIKRKHGKWIITLKGANPELSLPVGVILRDLLQVCENNKEVRKILLLGKVLVNKKKVVRTNAPVRLFDVLEISGAKNPYRLVLDDRGKLRVVVIPKQEAGKKLVKVIGKAILKKGVTQLNCNDGSNMLIKKEKVAVGDSLLVSLPDRKILKHLKLIKGVLIFVTGGSHMGETAKLADFHKFEGPQEDRMVLTSKKIKFETLEEYGFAVGTDKPVIKMQ